jgi:hypothetical protein
MTLRGPKLPDEGTRTAGKTYLLKKKNIDVHERAALYKVVHIHLPVCALRASM